MYRILIKRNDKVQPVLKWAGGKRQILNEISKYIPKNFNTYYEPFLGGGSVLFNIQPINAVVNDMNSELINMYQVVKDNVEELIQYLKAYRNNEEYFYKIRNLDRDKNIFNKLNHIERASRLIYLNRTCFNGLYRTNKSGEFNAPFGKYDNPTILNKDLLRAISKYFNIANIKFLNTDFINSLSDINKNDFVYFDPPYDVISDTSNFTSYTKDKFTKKDQVRLNSICNYFTNNKIRFLLSNAMTDFILELYKDYKIEIIQAKRSINSNPNKRNKISEVLIRNF